MMAAPLAVFDLDGTLIETGPDLVDSCNHVLSENDLPRVSDHVLHPFIGVGARRMIQGALTAQGMSVADEELDRLHAAYLEHYTSRIARYSRPFPEMAAAMDALDANGIAIAVCTNKSERLARLLFDTLGLTQRFVAIAGGDSFGVMKPNPEHLTRTVALADADLATTVFVGDSRIDRETARNAELPFVGIDYGYTDTPMADLKPDRLLSRGDDVAAAIISLLPS